jgi:hypothetical protein
MQPGGRRLFIYYRLDDRSVAAACDALRQAQRALCARYPGLHAELLQSPASSSSGERTLMETYSMQTRAESAGVDETLQAAIEAAAGAALRPWLAPAQRHLEVFIDMPCAS